MEKQISRSQEIIAEIKSLKAERTALPISDYDKATMNDTYQKHLEWSQKINELDQELAAIEGNKLM